jgi:hypothetical protein
MVEPAIVRRHDLPRGLRLGDLDERVWSNFPAESIGPLAAQVVSATRQVFPELAESPALARIDPSGGGLSHRARNALFRAGLLETPWLTEVPLSQLVGEQGVGAKTLLEWLVGGDTREAVEETGREERPTEPPRSPSRAVRKAADQIGRRRWAKTVFSTDPRLGGLLADLDPQATSALEAAELLASTPFDPATARRTARGLRSLRVAADRLRRLSLEEEIDQLVAATLDSSEAGRRAVKLRLGLVGDPPVTLGDAGEAVGLTRERVRQLESRFRDAITESRPWTPVLDKALRAVEQAVPATGAEIERLLVEKGLVRLSFSVESLISAARVFGRDLAFRHDDESGLVYAVGTTVAPHLVASEARRLTSHWGASTVESLRVELQERGAGDLEPALLRLLLEAVPGFNWLDDDKDWFWVRGTSRNRLLNQIEKIMSVAGAITIGELREGVGRFYRMEGFRPPREVLARLCEQSGLYQRDGEMILEGPDLPPWTVALKSTIERRIAEVLFEFGPVMRRDDLEQIAVEERGVNRSSFFVYLGYSPIIARYAPGVYGLRGARVTAGEVNALIPPRARRQRLVDSGWTSDGKVWIAFRMSAAALQSGVLTVPAALQDFVSGSYLLFSEQERPIGTLVAKDSRMWGVGPFYRRWGVEEGDYVVVAIDISERRATVAAGGEELLLRFQEAD